MNDNNQTSRLISKDYANKLSLVVSDIAEHNKVYDAFRLLVSLEKKLINGQETLKKYRKLNSFYKKEVKILKFIAIPLLDEKEIFSLLKKDFLFQFKLVDYNLFDKIKQKLISFVSVEERNKFKEEVKKQLISNTEKITINYKLKTIQEWIKEYIAKVLIGVDVSLSRAQYLISLRNRENIGPKEYRRLISLFDLYDFVNKPSDTPEGFEEEPVIVVKGKLKVFRQGELDEIKSRDSEYDMIRKLLKDYEESYDDSSDDADNIKEEKSTIESLKGILQNYSPDSLEYKVIQEEIKKISKDK